MSINIDYSSSPEECLPVYQALLDQSSDLWLWHNPYISQYLASVGSAEAWGMLIAREGKKCLGLMPYAVSPSGPNGECELSLGGWSLPYPAFQSNLKYDKTKLVKSFLQELTSIAKETNAEKISIGIFTQQKDASSVYLPDIPLAGEPGFLVRNEYSSCIDLALPADELIASYRKSTRYEINKNTTRFTFSRVENYDPSVFTRLKKLSTLSNINYHPALFDLLQYSLEHQCGHVFTAKELDGGEEIGFLAMLHLHKKAYLLMLASDPDYKHLSISHCLLHMAIMHLKQIDFSEIDLGFFSGHSTLCYVPSKKSKDIAFFKSGFATAYKNLYIFEKFLNPVYFDLIFAKRLNAFRSIAF